MIKLKDLKLDTRQFKDARVVSIKDWYEYENGERATKPSGISIEVLIERLSYEKIWVKVPDAEKFEFKNFQIINFENLEVAPYQDYKTNAIMLSAKASSFKLSE